MSETPQIYMSGLQFREANISFVAGTVGEQSANWIHEIFAIRAFQADVIRHPSKKLDTYYLCWEDEGNRFFVEFKGRNLIDRLRNLQPGERTPLYTMLPSGSADSVSPDGKSLCFG